MADLNYVSPLTSDLTDYYTKTEVDELQQGDENRFATQAQITAGDNEVKGWVSSQGYLTQHQSLQNYATKEYVDNAIEDIEVESGVKIRVVSNLPANPETNVIYLTRRSSEEDDNVYNEWIYVEDIEDFELIGDTSTGVIPDLTDYATKSYVDTAVAGIDAKDVAYDNQASGLEASNVKNAIDEVYAAIPTMPVLATVATSGDYLDLSNKPTIPYGANDISFGNYGTGLVATDAQAAILEVNAKVEAIDVPDVSGFVESSDLAAVATSGDFDDLINKPTIPSLTGYATQTYVNDAVAAIDIPDVSDFTTLSDVQSAASAVAQIEINNTVSAAGLSGSYNDLTDKPTIPAAPDLSSYATKSELSAKANAADLATVATSGSYNDLSNKPTIPSISGLASETYVDNAIAAIKGSEIDNDMNWIDEGMAKASAIDEINNNVSAAGLSGDYDDLTNKPTIPTVPTNVSSFTNDAGYLTSHQDISGKANIADLATIATSGDYDDLTNKPTIPSITGLATETYVDNAVAGISVPANTSDLTNDSGFITSADLPDTSGFVESSDLATVATTGDYDDLTNKPTIPVLPTLATVATSGSYNDLSDKPSIQEGGLNTLAGALFAILTSDNNINYIVKTASTKSDVLDYYNQGYIVNYTGSSALQLSPEDFGTVTNITYYDFQVTNITTGAYSTGFFTSGNVTMAVNSNTMICKLTDVVPMRFSKRNGMNWREVFDLIISKTLLKYSNTTSGLTASSIQGAIDELAAASGGGASTAAQLSYDNTNTWNDGTDTDTVQEAIDALYADVDGLDIPDAVGWSYDSSTGYMTFTGMNDESL